MNIFKSLTQYLVSLGVSDDWKHLMSHIVIFFGLLSLSILADLIAKKCILRVLAVIAGKTKTSFDDIIIKHRVPHSFAHLAPTLVFFLGGRAFFSAEKFVGIIISKGSISLLIIFSSLTIAAFLNAFADYSRRIPALSDKPIQSYTQVVKLVIYLITLVLVIGIVIDRSPLVLLSGLGAMTAILLLVFKDSILGLVASIQMSAYDMVRVGDWIEFPKYGADGDVLDISLNIIKVQNWDKTITSIPTHAFITDSFKNWRGMTLSGGRRIKRSISIDMSSVQFLKDDTVKKLSRIELLKDYISEKKKEITSENNNTSTDLSLSANGRRMTNLGTFRYYIEAFVKNHPDIRKDMTLIVRYLPATEKGMPIEIYAFSGDTRWKEYECIISDIFDHLLAVISEFELRVFQAPTGTDIRLALNTQNTSAQNTGAPQR